MNLRFFIDRPVFSIVISVIIVLLGIISLTGAACGAISDIAPPTVQSNDFLSRCQCRNGCRSRSLSRWREAINGVENMSYIHSEASIREMLQ